MLSKCQSNMKIYFEISETCDGQVSHSKPCAESFQGQNSGKYLN